MKHSEYKDLTRRLVFIAKEADQTRKLLTMPLSVTGDGAIVATSTPDQDGTPVEVNRAEIWRAVEVVDNDIAGLMDSLVDGFVEDNQGRADQGNQVTTDCRELIEAMEGFMSATSIPVKGWGVLYDRTRKKAREWMDQANTWFPDLNDNKEFGKESRPTSTTDSVKVNRDRMANLFKPPFLRPTTRLGMEPLLSGVESFCNALDSKMPMLCKWDIGSIALQVKESKVVLGQYQSMPFTKFARLFYDICGVQVPKSLDGPGKFKARTEKSDFTSWLVVPGKQI